MFPRVRLDTLSDGVFAVAMTLLVLDLRLPEDFHPRDGAELVLGFIGLWPKLLPYLLSFWVLGQRWLANLEVRSQAEYLPREYVNWWLLYQLLITCVPFSTIVVGRYANLAPSVWLYAGHTLLISLVGLRMVAITPHLERDARLRRRQLSAYVLIGASVLAIMASLVAARDAMWAFALPVIMPLMLRGNQSPCVPD